MRHVGEVCSGMRSRQRCGIVGIGRVEGVMMKGRCLGGIVLSRKLRRGVRTSANLGYDHRT
jgi:hypothetical protein